MTERVRILVLIGIMSSIAVGAVAISLRVLYMAAFAQERERLRETVQSRARIIEAVAQYDLAQAQLHGESQAKAFEATLSQIRNAHKNFAGFGETGEFTLARREGDQIVFLLSQRHFDRARPMSVPFSSEVAEPMRRALSGRSGTVVGQDYRGAVVLAAHEPVAVHGLGIVAKIDLEEVRKPFIRATELSLLFAIVFVALGTVLFLRIGNPIIERLDREVAEHKAAREKLAASEASQRLMVSEVRDYAIFLLDSKGCVASWNAGAEAINGYTKDEIIGQHFSCFHTPEDIESGQPARELEIAAQTGRHDGEGVRVRKDGTRFFANVTTTALRDTEERLIGFSEVTRDISDRRRAEDEIRQSLQEKEVLLHEIHHRVKNNLQIVSSLLNLQTRRITDPAAVTALQESRNRINTMALVHQKLYGAVNLGRVDFHDYVETFANSLLRASQVDSSRVELVLAVNRVELDVQQAIPAGMIVNELLSNAIKHAFPDGRSGKITISLDRHDNHHVLDFADNGVGLPEGFEIAKSESLGLQLVTMFTKQLDGQIQRLPGEGLRLRVTFAAKKE